MRFTTWSLIRRTGRAFIAAWLVLTSGAAHAQYSDIYSDVAAKEASATETLSALPDGASEADRAKAVSDAIMALTVMTKNKQAYDLFDQSRALSLNRPAMATGLGLGLMQYAPDAAVEETARTLMQMAEDTPRAGDYGPALAAHYLGHYYFERADDLANSVKWFRRSTELAERDFPDDPTRINFETLYVDHLNFADREAGSRETERVQKLAFDLLDDDHLLWIGVLTNQAYKAQNRGRHDLAADLWLRTIDIAGSEWSEDNQILFGLFQYASISFAGMGQQEKALQYALRTLPSEKHASVPDRAMNRSLIGEALYRVGRPEEAVARFREGLAILEGHNPGDLRWGHLEISMAQALSAMGEHEEATALADKALAQYAAKLPPFHPGRVTANIRGAIAYTGAGDAAKANALLTAAVQTNEAKLLDTYAKSQDVRSIAIATNGLFRHAAYAALLDGDLETGWRNAQLTSLSELGMSAASLSYPGDAAGFTKAVDEAREARTKVDEVRVQFADGKATQADLEAAITARDTAQERLQSGYPDYAEMLRPKPLSIAEAKALMGTGDAYILPLSYGSQMATIVVTREGLSWGQTRIPLLTTRKLLRSLRASLELGVDESEGAAAFDREAAHEMYRRIFNPEVQAAIRGKTRLIFPAGGILSRIPPSVLLTKAASDDAPLPYLIRDFAVALTPNLGGYQAAETRAASAFAGIGAPLLAAAPRGRASLRGMDVDIKDIAALPSLPGAQSELEAMRGAFPGEAALVLTGKDATEGAVRAAKLDHFRVVAFSTHGLVSGQIAGLSEPALVLTPPASDQGDDGDDGLLTASEIASLKLAADWIILSACNTAAGDGRGNATYSGLARAFQLAGARSLLLSHWPVRDDAATRLSVATVKAAANGVERSEALRQAQLALIADSEMKGAASPSIWAPFVLIE
ncbi:MAG: CHAT domain-containing tetratricopeptide repeat protein [Pseudomonadota bacterium]